MDRTRRERGFSLVELMIAVAVVGIVVYGSSGLLVVMMKSIDVDREKIIMTNLAANRAEEWQAYDYAKIAPGMNFVFFGRNIANSGNDYQIFFSSITTTVDGQMNINHRPAGGTPPASGYSIQMDQLGLRSGVDFVNNNWYVGPASGGTEPGVIVATITCPSGARGTLQIGLIDTVTSAGGFTYGGQRGERIYINGFLSAEYDNFTGAGVTYTEEMTQDKTASGKIIIRLEQCAALASVSYDTFADSPNPDAVLSFIRFSVIEGFTEEIAYFPYQIKSEVISTFSESALSGLVPSWKIWVTVSKPGTKYRPIEMVTTIVK